MSRVGPFPGLVPYGQDDAETFFGRDLEIEIVVGNARARNVVVLYGPSGVGKSSLLLAGVIARLRDEDDGASVVVVSSWATGAAAALTASLAAHEGDVSGAAGVEAPLDKQLAAAADRTNGRLYVVLDQFEELLASGHAPDEHFADVMADADDRVRFLLGIREDALSDLDLFDGVVPGLLDNLVRLRHLSHAGAADAITGAIAGWNATHADRRVDVEPALIERLLDELSFRDADGAARVRTPYLQLVLARLWREDVAVQGHRRLTTETLDALGGSDGIIARHVDDALASRTQKQQSALARVLDRLVTPTGAKIPQRPEDLALHARVETTEMTELLEELTRGARILEPLGDGRYQLSHDALSAPLGQWGERRAYRTLRRRQRRRLLFTVAFVVVLLWLASLANAFDPLESQTVSARFEIRGTQSPPSQVMLVAVDDASLERLGVQLPVPRRTIARALDEIIDGGARAVAVDLVFASRTADDTRLLESLYGADGRVVLAALATDGRGGTNLFDRPSSLLRELRVPVGFAGLDMDGTGIVRRPTAVVEGLPTLAAATARAAGKTVDTERFDGAWIDLRGPAGTVSTVPLWRVLAAGQDRAARFRGKVVVLGVTAGAARDVYPVWGLELEDMSGAELHATALDTILRDLPLRDTPVILTLVAVLVLSLLPILAAPRIGRVGTALATLVAAGAYLVVAQLLFESGVVVPVVVPLAGLLISALAVALTAAVAETEGR